MNAQVGWLLGLVTARITGAQTEGFLNRCAREGIHLRRMARRDPFTLEIQVTRGQYRRTAALAEACQCTVDVTERWGLPFLLGGVRRRYALLAGLALCLLAGTLGGNVILTLEVEGNETIPPEVILGQLRLCGVSTGTWGPSVNIHSVENRMMLAMEGLSYFALNLHGTRAEVVVREADPAPDLKDEETPSDLVATADGILTHLEPWSGDAQFLEGDPVRKGEVLISGKVTLYHYRLEDAGAQAGSRLVHADGRAEAMTWRTFTADLPLTARGKEYTGRETTRRTLSVMGHRMKFYENSGIPYGKCDIITQLKTWTPVESKTLPVIWETVTYREYTESPRPLDPAKAEAMLRQELERALTQCMGEEGEVLQRDVTAQRQGDTLTVTLLAQCREEIGRVVPMDTREKVRPPLHSEKGSYGQDEINTKEQSP